MKAELSLARFKSNVRKGLPTPGRGGVRKGLPISIESLGSSDDRRKAFTISTETVDRDNDTISVKGWQLDNYIKAPVVFFNHRSHDYPIGRTTELDISKGALTAVVQFVPPDVPDGAGATAEACFQLVDGHFLCAASVGFKPIEYSTAKDRMDDDDWWPAIDFTKQELMEWSVVGIPANPDATVLDEERAACADLQKLWQDERAAEAAAAIERAAGLVASEKLRRELRAAAYC